MALDPKTEALREAILLAGEGERAYQAGDVETARNKWYAAIEASRRAGDSLREAELYNKLGYSRIWTGDFLGSSEEFDTGLNDLLNGGVAVDAAYRKAMGDDFPVDEELLRRADAAFARGREMRDRKACDKALPYLRESVDLYRASGLESGEIVARVFVAVCDIDPNDPAGMLKALPALGRTLILAVRLPVGDRATEIYLKAKSLHDQGRVQDARRLYEEVLQLHVDSEDTEREANVRLNLGALHAESMEYREARSYLSQALRLYTELESPHRGFNLAATHHNLAGIASQTGMFRESLRAGYSALNLWRQIGRVDQEFQTRMALGFVFAEMGALDRAQAMLEEARELFRRLPPDPMSKLTLTTQLGMVQYRRGRIASATRHMEGITDLEEMGDRLPTYLHYLGAISNLAAARAQAGRYDEALRVLERAQHAAAAVGTIPPILRTLIDFNRASLLAKAGRWKEARELYLDLLKEPPPAMAGRFSSYAHLNLTLLGILIEPDSDIEQRLQHLSEADHNVEDTTYLIRLDIAWALLRVKQSRFEEARELVQGALLRSRDADESVPPVAFHIVLSRIDALQGNFESMNRHLRRALEGYEDMLENLPSPTLLQTFLNMIPPSFLYSLASLPALRRGDLATAFSLSERGRSLVLNARWQQASFPAPEPPESTSLFREALDTRSRIAELQERREAPGADSQSLARDLDAARRRYARTLMRLEIERPRLADMVRSKPMSLSELQRLLPHDTAVISYTIMDHPLLDRVPDVNAPPAFVWVVDSQEIHWTILPLAGSELRRKVRYFRDLVQADDPAADSLARELHASLVAPLLQFVHHDRLWIVPDGPLHDLPFGALIDAETGRHLIDPFTVSRLPSATALRRASPTLSTVSRSDTIVFGDPQDSLPQARREARRVADTTGGEVWLGDKATESRLRNRLGNASRLHLATHGVLNAPHPLFSHLRLAKDSENDGYLEAHEILELDLRGLDLVALSGCETGVGPIHGSGDVSSLGRAFLAAGAHQVLDTLWPVQDDVSAHLFDAFYRHLESTGDAAASLRHAQKVVKSEHPESRAWAGFVLRGTNRLAAN